MPSTPSPALRLAPTPVPITLLSVGKENSGCGLLGTYMQSPLDNLPIKNSSGSLVCPHEEATGERLGTRSRGFESQSAQMFRTPAFCVQMAA